MFHFQGIANFMGKARGGRVRFDPSRIVMGGGATGASEMIIFCLADPGDAFLVPSPYYPALVLPSSSPSLHKIFFFTLVIIWLAYGIKGKKKENSHSFSMEREREIERWLNLKFQIFLKSIFLCPTWKLRERFPI